MINIIDTVTNLISLPHEYEWLDFKENWFFKDEIGEYISAISNGAALSERSGRGVPKIVEAYGRSAIRIEKNFIVITIPFNKIDAAPFEMGDVQEKTVEKNYPENEKSTVKVDDVTVNA